MYIHKYIYVHSCIYPNSQSCDITGQTLHILPTSNITAEKKCLHGDCNWHGCWCQMPGLSFCKTATLLEFLLTFTQKGAKHWFMRWNTLLIRGNGQFLSKEEGCGNSNYYSLQSWWAEKQLRRYHERFVSKKYMFYKDSDWKPLITFTFIFSAQELIL